MEYPTLDAAKLSQLDDTFYYSASCNSCHHSVRLSLVKLRADLGDDFPLVDVRTRLKCRQCGSRQIIIAYYTPAHAVTSLGPLFKEPFGL